MTRTQLYLVLAVIGTVVPWIFFARFFAAAGFDLPLFLRSLFSNERSRAHLDLVSLVLAVAWARTWAVPTCRSCPSEVHNRGSCRSP